MFIQYDPFINTAAIAQLDTAILITGLFWNTVLVI